MNKYLIGGIIGVLILILASAVAFFISTDTRVGNASLSVFAPTDCYTAAATSTLTYMTAGTATSTVTCWTGNDAASEAVLAIVVNASTTSSIFNIFVEESMDNQDWFPISLNQSASTTSQFDLTVRSIARFTFASSTIGAVAKGTGSNYLGVTGTNNRNHYTVDIPVRMKWVRAHAGIEVGADNGAVWMKVIPKQGI